MVIEPTSDGDMRDEIDRIKRVSDMLVSGHSNLHEKFERYALGLDSTILALTIWIAVGVFIQPRIGMAVTPFGIEPEIWIGLLSVLALIFSVVQLRVDWKRKSDAHQRSAEMYSKVKANCRYLLESKSFITRDDAKELLVLYDMSGNLGTPMPEKEFLRQKAKHLTKVAISRYLDAHPTSSVTLLRIRMWWRDNLANAKELPR